MKSFKAVDRKLSSAQRPQTKVGDALLGDLIY